MSTLYNLESFSYIFPKFESKHFFLWAHMKMKSSREHENLKYKLFSSHQKHLKWQKHIFIIFWFGIFKFLKIMILNIEM